ncbi:MAG: transglutaminase-like domain-containing protein [Verrucomicrobia bacterium]|nr:transglutaminase-like domain-containing protein [Verrucomicrobiota bacterium]
MKPHRQIRARIAALVALGLLTTPLFGLTLEDLRRDTKLTPQRFAHYFAHFKFEFHANVQSPDQFLAGQAGDCDDYATLAATILREKGYTTRLVTVRMPGAVHVVCYVAETRCFLDYNDREFPIRTVASNGSLTDIARKVAWSFGDTWTSASEFTFVGGHKQTVTTIDHDGTIHHYGPTLTLARRAPHDIPVNF